MQAFADKNTKDVEEGLPGAKAEDGQALVDILRYIVHESSSEREYPNGVRDKGRGSVSLSYFLDHEKAKVGIAPILIISTSIVLQRQSPVDVSGRA